MFIYNFFIIFLVPFATLRLFWKARKNPLYVQRIPERFGLKLPQPFKNLYLIHTVSVGEFLSLRPLLEYILNREPNTNLWITTTTPTGSQQVIEFIKQYPNRCQHSYLPYDIDFVIRHFLKRLQPRAILLMETEIWINLINEAANLKIPVVLENARLSARSCRRYRKFTHFLLAKILPHLKINAQNRFDARRFRYLGAEKIKISPSLKFHCTPKTHTINDAFARRAELVWIAASTHSNEEKLILAAHKIIQQHIDAQLIIAPRHPERRNEINKLSKMQWRSRGEKIIDLYLLDTLGELSSFFALADVAFIGGSLINHGGHNPLEALHAGIPICFGKNMWNFQTIRDELIQKSFVREITNNDPEEIAKYVLELKNSDKSAIKNYSNSFQNLLQTHYEILTKFIS